MVNIQFDVPAEMLKLAQNPGTKERPYDLCQHCLFQGETCDGPNCLAMNYDRWVQWVNVLAKKKHMTRLMIAEKANRPLSTINTVLSGDAKDVKASTMADITKAVLGGTWGQYPCHIAALLLNGQIGNLHAEKSVDQIKQDFDKQSEDAQKKIEFLKKEIDVRDRRIEKLDKQLESNEELIKRRGKIITALTVAGFVLLCIIIISLIVDRANPNVGFFWRSVETAFGINAAGSGLVRFM